MSAKQVTKSENILCAYAEARELDREAMPLVPDLGIQLAYQAALESIVIRRQLADNLKQ